MNSPKAFHKIINELCVEKNIKQNPISYGWITELKKNGISKHIIDNRLDLNSSNSYIIAGDKFATYEVLKSHEIPTIEHRIIFNPQTRSKYYKNKFLNDAKKLLEENESKVVIKANSSCQGKDVYFCSDAISVEKTVNKLFEERNDTLSACPYVDIEYEYRVIFLCGEILYVYKKKKPYVIGDGKSKIKELIYKKFSNDVKLDISENLDLDKIPTESEEVSISWKHNLSGGAEPILVDETDINLSKIKEMAINAGNALNIKFASIDIALTYNQEILVMEVNGSVCMNKFTELVPGGYEIAKGIFSKAIDQMFKENK